MKKFTKRDLIIECVKAYIRNNPKEYQLIKEEIAKKRASMPWNSWGEFLKNGKVDEDMDYRLSLRLPKSLYETINTVLKAEKHHVLFKADEPRDADKEFKWFMETFKVFVVPDLTHKRVF